MFPCKVIRWPSFFPPCWCQLKVKKYFLLTLFLRQKSYEGPIFLFSQRMLISGERYQLIICVPRKIHSRIFLLRDSQLPKKLPRQLSRVSQFRGWYAYVRIHGILQRYRKFRRLWICACAHNATPERITRRNVTRYTIRARRRDITMRGRRDSYFVEYPRRVRTNERTVSKSYGIVAFGFSAVSRSILIFRKTFTEKAPM